MSYAVMNGAVGKSPLIDKMNEIPAVQMCSQCSRQLEKMVCEQNHAAYQPITVSFQGCRKEMKEQLGRYKEERGERH